MSDKRIEDLGMFASGMKIDQLEAFVDELDSADQRDVAAWLQQLAQDATAVSTYMEFRSLGQSHDNAAWRAITRLRDVRRALGFAYP